MENFEIVEDKTLELTFIVKDESHGVCNALRHILMQDPDVEYAVYNIRCNIVAPGSILTPLSLAMGEEEIEAHRKKTPLRITGLPEDVAEAVAYCNSARMLTGEVISPNGGLRNYSFLYQEEPED